MLKEKVGQVTDPEKDEILKLYERKIALQELMMSLDDQDQSEKSKNDLYERIVADLGKTKVNFDRWWADKSRKYNWKSVPGGNWNIDFETNDIFLVGGVNTK
jgi:CXXX repeat modification system protein